MIEKYKIKADETSYIVEILKQKYKNINLYDRKKEIDFNKFPSTYFSDLKYFLECKNMPAVRTLLMIADGIPLKNPIGKLEMRDFKNALIVFSTLFMNVVFQVNNNRSDAVSVLMNLISNIEEIDDSQELRSLVLDSMSSIIRGQGIDKSIDSNSILVQKALTIVRNRYRENIGLKALAKELEVSESYLSRSVKRETHKTLSEHILMLRLEESKQLLIRTDAPVHDIALSMGFNYQNHFASVFKKQVGMTPLEFRRRHFR